MVLTRARKFQIANIAVVLVALVLRIFAAQGDLWQDEITSLRLAGAAHSAAGVFMLSYDNNHFLNTLYLYLVGPNAPPLVLRGLSIALGTLSVIAAGAIFAGRRTRLLAMTLFALSFPMVNYGSEARGYAGLILCTLLAIHALHHGKKIQMAFAVAFGLLFHLSMIAGAGALLMAALEENWHKTKSHLAAIKDTIAFLLPTLCGAIAVALLVAIGADHSQGYHFGALMPFSISDFAAGYGGMIDAMIGLPDDTNPVIGLGLAILAGVLCYIWRKPGDTRPMIYCAFLIALPVMVFICHIPNSGIRRYYMCSAAVFLLCMAQMAGEAWRNNNWQRAMVAFAVAAFLGGQVYNIAEFMHAGRGQYSEAVTFMTASGPTTYAGDDNEFPARIELNYYAHKKGVDLTYVPETDSCTTAPQWFAIETPLIAPREPPLTKWGALGCPQKFAIAHVYEGWGISGARLTLYRRVE